MQNQNQFLPGTTVGESAWLILQAMKILAPMAPAIFGRQNLAGQTELDMDKWVEGSKKLALQIQKEAAAMTPEVEEATFFEGTI